MKKTWLVFSQAVTVSLGALFVVGTLKPQWLPGASAPAPTLFTAPASGAASAAAGYRFAAERAAPAVVSIVASKAARVDPESEDPRWRFFFGDRGGAAQPQVGLGSGVIVAPEGYLLTNHHVVDGADDIEVQLADGRRAAAALIGTDPESDLAVLRIELDALPVVAFAPSGSLQVGDVVLAIGNPFNVGQTVTAGIVSALGRSRLGLSTYEHFIQTDAAINPGNSGGALVDAEGRLAGINTAIFSRGGGSLGIGFAVPAHMARAVLEAIVRDGRVTRGWIGIEPRDLSDDYVQAFKLPVREGVLVAGVLGNGPAARGGLRPGDVVVAVGERPVADTTALLEAVAALAPGRRARLQVQRGDQTLVVEVTVAQRPTPGR